MHRRQLIQAASGLAGLAVAPCLRAQDKFPSKAITFVVGFSPGGGGDHVARLLGTALAQRLESPVIVENKPGASGNIAGAYVMKSTPDGYTLLNLSSTYAIQAAVGNLSYEPLEGMQPIMMAVREPLVLLVNPASGWKNSKDLAAAAMKSPGTVTHGSAGLGSIAHLGMEELAYRMNVKMLHIPYKGSAAAMTGLLANSIDLVLTTVTFAKPFIESGKVRAIGISGTQRLPSLPNVPTFAEQGWPKYQVFDWKAVAGPKGIPASVVAKLNGELNAVLVDKAVAEKFAVDGTTPVGGTPEDMMKVVRDDVSRWKELIAKAGITIQ